jgi:predicted RNA-binding protein with PUA-like domain
VAKRWLVKTEPSAYPFERLQREHRTVWDGVTNPLALKYLGQMRRGDRVIVYHTGSEKAAVGIARVVRGPYADPTQKGSRLVVVDLAADRPLLRPVTLTELKANPLFADLALLRLPRLSVMPMTAAHWSALEALSKTGLAS